MEEQTQIMEKVKDPKKVAAGKALAKKNKEARAAATPKQPELQSDVGVAETPNESLTFTDVSNKIQSAAAFVGVGLVFYQGWILLSPYMNKRSSDVSEYKSPPPPPPPPPTTQAPSRPSGGSPRFPAYAS